MCVARYCADLISRLSLVYYEKSGVDRLQLPTHFHIEKTMYLENMVIGYIARHTVDNNSDSDIAKNREPRAA